MKFKKVNPWLAILGGVVAIAFLYLSSNLVTCLDELLRLTGYSKSASMPFEINTIGNLFIGVLVLALAPAFIEEMLFRGMLLNGLLDGKSSMKKKIIALIIAALAFACIHQSMQQFAYPFMCAILFGAVYLFTGNIWYSIIMHFCSNAMVVVSNYVNSLSTTVVEPVINIDFGFVMVSLGLFLAGVAIAVGYIFLLKKYIKNNDFMEEENTDASDVDGVKETIIHEDGTTEVVFKEASNTDDSQGSTIKDSELVKRDVGLIAKYKFLIAFGISIILLIVDLITYIV